jgi:lysophospholipase L1-like esterase
MMRNNLPAILLPVVLLAVSCSGSSGPGQSASEEKEHWLFLGNSITQAGHYVDYIETWFLLNEVNPPEITDLGLSSETVSCLSEPDHPFPRPCLHSRLDSVLKRTRPDVVVACYGMNCGIYHPYSQERFTAYKEGIRKLVVKAKAAGAKVILVTPPPYAGRVQPKTPPAEGETYGYKRPSEDYNETLARYAEWILSLEEEEGIRTIDIRPGLEKHMEKCYPWEPVHPSLFGHQIMAESILQGLGKVTGSSILETGAEQKIPGRRWNRLLELVKQQRETYDRALLNHIGHGNPMVAVEFSISLSVADSLVKPVEAEIEKLLEQKKGL